MKKLLATTALMLAMAVSPAMADAITATATVDGVLVSAQSSANGTLDINNQSFGGIFNLNSLSISSQSFLAGPGLLRTNTLNVDQAATGNHELIINIIATGLVGSGALQGVLSSFSVTGMDTDWKAREQTFINGTQLADTGFFTQTSDSAFSIDPAILTNPFTAAVRYTIDSVGVGQFNGGINISAAAVPGPIAGAGIPGIVVGCFGLLGLAMKRRRRATLPA